MKYPDYYTLFSFNGEEIGLFRLYNGQFVIMRSSDHYQEGRWIPLTDNDHKAIHGSRKKLAEVYQQIRAAAAAPEPKDSKNSLFCNRHVWIFLDAGNIPIMLQADWWNQNGPGCRDEIIFQIINGGHKIVFPIFCTFHADGIDKVIRLGEQELLRWCSSISGESG